MLLSEISQEGSNSASLLSNAAHQKLISLDFVNEQLTFIKHPKTSAETMYVDAMVEAASKQLLPLRCGATISVGHSCNSVAARVMLNPCCSLLDFVWFWLPDPPLSPSPKFSSGHISSTWKLVLDGIINPLRRCGSHHVEHL